MPKGLPSPDYLRKVLDYYPDTGEFFWKHRPVSMFEGGLRSALHECNLWNSRFEGFPAFTVKHTAGRGYVGKVDGYAYMAHRVAYAMHYGHLSPSDEVVHVNGNPFDNRAENLALKAPKGHNGKHTRIELVEVGQGQRTA
jgi:hypothetical protein